MGFQSAIERALRSLMDDKLLERLIVIPFVIIIGERPLQLLIQDMSELLDISGLLAEFYHPFVSTQIRFRTDDRADRIFRSDGVSLFAGFHKRLVCMFYRSPLTDQIDIIFRPSGYLDFPRIQ
jgi:hypothetical protein